MSRRPRSESLAGTLERIPQLRKKRRELIGSSAVMQDLRRFLARIAKSHLPVLIYGETGTGKELVARAIHEQSLRSSGPWIPVNCATLTPQMAHSQLFGHARGAFTGAEVDCKGYFQVADQGTLFLDEIGEMPREVQPKLLRSVEEGTLVRLGESSEIAVDVRLVGATHADLTQKDSFREDLYHRLAGHIVSVPSLDERRSDIPEILDATFGEAWRDRFVPSGLNALLLRPYPGTSASCFA